MTEEYLGYLDKNCELCEQAHTYNEDMNIWCNKFNKQVSGAEAPDCKFYDEV